MRRCNRSRYGDCSIDLGWLADAKALKRRLFNGSHVCSTSPGRREFMRVGELFSTRETNVAAARRTLWKMATQPGNILATMIAVERAGALAA